MSQESVDKIKEQMDEAAGLGLFAATTDRNLGALIERAQQEYQRRIDQLEAMIESEDLRFDLGCGKAGNEFIKIEPGTRDHAMLKAGISIAIEVMGAFPIRSFSARKEPGNGDQ